MTIIEYMIDAIGTDRNLPALAHASVRKAAGYDTGSVAWTPSDWQLFDETKIAHVHISQSASDYRDLVNGTSHVGDIEPLAETIDGFITAVKNRIAAGHGPATAYISAASVNAAHARVVAEGIANNVWWWIADWSLTEQQARGRLTGKVVAVQYASPTSNPGTRVPGTQLTLQEAGADLSVALATWMPVQNGPLVAVPNVVGNSTIQAVHSIQAAGLKPGPQSAVPGTVYSQTPGGGHLVAPGSIVDIGVRPNMHHGTLQLGKFAIGIISGDGITWTPET